MAASPDPTESAGSTVQQTTTTTTETWIWEKGPARRALPLLLGALGLGGLLLTDATLQRSRIEDTLQRKAVAALTAAGHDDVTVNFDGRDATLRGSVGSDADIEGARVIVRNGTGVRHAEAALTVEATAADAASSAVSAELDVTIIDGKVVLRGAVPDEAARAVLVDAAVAVYGNGNVDDQLSIDPTVSGEGIDGFAELFDALGDQPGDVSIAWSDGAITLTGEIGSDALSAAAAARAAAVVGEDNVANGLVVAAPATTARPTTTTQVQTTTTQAADEEAAEQVEEEVQAELATLEDINFETGSAALAADGLAKVDLAFALLDENPAISIAIRGHTDNRGDPTFNEQLSADRANAVRDALIAKGIDESRLTAEGVGDSEPVAPNDTDENLARNRRIEFVVQ